jgi:hypothetical protein
MAIESKVLIGGDDFKSGQTKLKSVLVDFLVGAGLKPVSIVSYNHLGNNDGCNLSAPQTFRSKVCVCSVCSRDAQSARDGRKSYNLCRAMLGCALVASSRALLAQGIYVFALCPAGDKQIQCCG